jgi:hypothetical protein
MNVIFETAYLASFECQLVVWHQNPTLSSACDIRVILKIIFRLHGAQAGDKFLSTS